ESLPHLITAAETGVENVRAMIRLVYENARIHGGKEHRKNHLSPFDILGIAYK
ncbi:hypothetical protein SAMN05421677_1281, partial [Halobacillus aidingensis]